MRAGEGDRVGEDIETDCTAEVRVGFLEEESGWMTHSVCFKDASDAVW